MDFIEGFPNVGGKSIILIVVDRFSKFAHFILLTHPYSASSITKAFFDNIVRLHGLPCSIVSDRDPVFMSGFWKELFRLTGVKLLLSSSFHSQMDGQSKVVNRTIATYLRCLAGDRPRSWLQWLPWVEFCYNSSYHTTLKTTPFKVVYGRDPPTLLKYQPGSCKVAVVDVHLKERDEFLEQVREHLLLAQDVMKHHHDGKHRALGFDVGEWTWLRLHHRSGVRITPLRPTKLSPRFYGPYRVVERIGEVAYQLHLPAKSSEMVPLPPNQHGVSSQL
jgi:hypothetical protein